MRLLYLMVISVIGYSCCDIHHETTYTFQDQVITRIDKCSETSFYYQSGKEKSKGKIFTKYSGINDGFSGYLKFDDSGVVTIMSGDGYFQMENIDTSKFKYHRIYSYSAPELGRGVYYINLARNAEMDRNNGVESGVKAEYHD